MNFKSLKMALLTVATLTSVQGFAGGTVGSAELESIWGTLKGSGVLAAKDFVSGNQTLAIVADKICELRQSAGQAVLSCNKKVLAEGEQAVELASILEEAGLFKYVAGAHSGRETIRQFSTRDASQCVKTSRTLKCGK